MRGQQQQQKQLLATNDLEQKGFREVELGRAGIHKIRTYALVTYRENTVYNSGWNSQLEFDFKTRNA